ncbi:MAG: M48 family metalloprotease, partial [Pseudomonadales bacterium]|nr:M48 family metallopeptidase [Pseudomonadales bacterium]NIX07565.1 M48 family metalloprotease [Pseudomonadales bacterium]
LIVTAAVVAVVGIAGLYKYLVIRDGGKTIAEALGGRRINSNTTDPAERRLLNVVEEMAIASGTAVPPVYLIPEHSINAFAAGFTPDDAVIGINQGTLDQLNRDELQGVVGHEFSHILNGDSRINLRLIAMLHGILFIGMIGYGILRGMAHGGNRRSGGNAAVPVMALGLGLLIIGYSGTFFGNLIKAAVSRQREYLADAAAVQFTRNPSGLANALKRIGGLPVGSTMSGPSAREISHMFFGQCSQPFFSGLMSTHPPLEDRIRAIEPRWDGRLLERGQPSPSRPGAAGFAAPGTAGTGSREGIAVTVPAEGIADEVGRLDQRSLDSAVGIITSIDPKLREAAHDPWSGRGLIYATLTHVNGYARDRQLAYLEQNAEPGVPEHVFRLVPAVRLLDEPRKLALVEMAVPALKELSDPQFRRFIDNVVAMIKLDRQIDLFEWVMHRLLIKELRPHFDGPERIRARYRSIDQVADAALTVLSALARSGHEDARGQADALASGAELLDIAPRMDANDDPNFVRLGQALWQLRHLKPLVKPRVLKACAAVALADG